MINRLLDWLFPRKCPFCRKVLEEGLVCPACVDGLPKPRGEQTVEFTKGCISPLTYSEAVRGAIHRFKFQNCPGYAGAFAMLMGRAVGESWPQTAFDAVSWVPLSSKRRKKRGYDQAELLARALGEELDLPVEPLLVKLRDNPPQSLQADEGSRRVNVLGAYELTAGAAVEGKTILLADDVVTTGSTLSEGARILRTAGAKEVYCVTLARAGK